MMDRRLPHVSVQYVGVRTYTHRRFKKGWHINHLECALSETSQNLNHEFIKCHDDSTVLHIRRLRLVCNKLGNVPMTYCGLLAPPQQRHGGWAVYSSAVARTTRANMEHRNSWFKWYSVVFRRVRSLSSRNSWAPTTRIFVKVHILAFFEKSFEEI